MADGEQTAEEMYQEYVAADLPFDEWKVKMLSDYQSKQLTKGWNQIASMGAWLWMVVCGITISWHIVLILLHLPCVARYCRVYHDNPPQNGDAASGTAFAVALFGSILACVLGGIGSYHGCTTTPPLWLCVVCFQITNIISIAYEYKRAEILRRRHGKAKETCAASAP